MVTDSTWTPIDFTVQPFEESNIHFSNKFLVQNITFGYETMLFSNAITLGLHAILLKIFSYGTIKYYI